MRSNLKSSAKIDKLFIYIYKISLLNSDVFSKDIYLILFIISFFIIYKLVRNVIPPNITPVAFGIIRIQSFLGSLVHP